MLITPVAGAEPGFRGVATVPVPTDVEPTHVTYQSIACVSAGNCSAIGSAFDEPFVVQQTAGSWGSPQQLEGYMTGGYDVNGPMRIACPATGACVAVGGEQSGGDFGPGSTPIVEFPYVVTESGARWGKIAFVAPPADADAATPRASFTSLWCSSPGNCVAVGPYATSTNTTRAMEISETNGVWGSTTALPGSEGPVTAVYFSCSSPGDCTAISEEAAWTETAGVWGEPSAFGQAGDPTLAFQPDDLSCDAPGTCIAVGAAFPQGSSDSLPASDVETDGTWEGVTVLPLPKLSAIETGAMLSSISCQASACVAVGTGGHTGEIYRYADPIAATWSNGTWSSIGIDQVGQRNEDDDSGFQSVSCPPTAPCEAIGQRATWTLPGGPTHVSQFEAEISPVERVAAPGPPATVVAYAAIQAVEVTWTPPTEDGGSPVTSYTATLSPGGATCVNTSPFCAFYGLVNGRQYVVTVHAANATGTSSQRTFSNHVFAGAIPSTPINLRAVRTGDGQFAWTASTSPSGEPVLRYEVTALGGGRTYHCVATHTSCVVKTLPRGGTYAVTVSAFDATGWSGPSQTLAYRTRTAVRG